jgi:hypothetical protein
MDVRFPAATPGTGGRIGVIFDRAGGCCLPVDVRFAPDSERRWKAPKQKVR